MIHVGGDISKLKIDVCYGTQMTDKKMKKQQFASFANTVAGIDKLCASLPEDAFVVFESTGPYSKLLYKTLCDRKISCACMNPYRVAQFLRSCGRSAKTDQADAFGLTFFGERMQPKPTQFGNEKDVKLQEMVRARDVLMKDIRSYKNRLEVPYASDEVNIVFQNMIDSLEAQLKIISIKIDEFIAQDAEYARKTELLQTIPGIGSSTSIAALAHCPEAGTLSAKQIGSLAGVVPRTKQSGTTYVKEHIGGGRKQFRSALYMSALVAVRCDAEMHAMYQGLISRGKPKKVALTAVIRHLSILANAVLKRGFGYEKRGELPSHKKKAA